MSDFWYKYHNEELPYVQYTENLNTGEILTSMKEQGYTQIAKKVETFNEAAGTKTIIVKDLYQVVAYSFKSILLVLFYVLAMFAVSFHLIHGFQSAFQTIGANHPKYTPLFKFLGIWIFGILIPIGYAAMPIYFYFLK